MEQRAKGCGKEELDFSITWPDMDTNGSEGDVRWGVDGWISTNTGRIWTRIG